MSTALRQHYLRGQMVNSEEGTPMGVGIWYEMQVNDPVAYLFINTNPEGSLQANVASSTISTLSNLEMDKMLEDRHSLSRTVRADGLAAVGEVGLPPGLGLHPQGRLHRSADGGQHHREGGQAAGPGHQRHEAGRREPRRADQSETANKVSQKMAEAQADPPGRGRPGAERDRHDRTRRSCSAVLDVMEAEKLIESGAEIDVLPAETQVFVQLGSASGGGVPALTLDT